MTTNRSRSAHLAHEILGRIARGELRPGDAIDIGGLCERHAVSRTVVREALADLGGKGMVVARPKVGTLVAPSQGWNLLDPALLDLAACGPRRNPLAREALELRVVVEPAIAAGTAMHARQDEVRALLDALRTMGRALASRAFERWCQADADFHAALAAGCGNRLLQSIDHALAPVRARRRRALRATEWRVGDGPDGAPHLLALRTLLGLAIARRNAAEAEALARELALRDLQGVPLPAEGGDVHYRAEAAAGGSGEITATEAIAMAAALRLPLDAPSDAPPTAATDPPAHATDLPLPSTGQPMATTAQADSDAARADDLALDDWPDTAPLDLDPPTIAMPDGQPPAAATTDRPTAAA